MVEALSGQAEAAGGMFWISSWLTDTQQDKKKI